MAVLGVPRIYHPKFRFVVEIDGILTGSFQSCSELSSEFAEITQWEGGALIPDKSPGRLTYDDITLSRGVTGNDELYKWHRSLGEAVTNRGLNAPFFKRNLDIVQLDRTGIRVRTWQVFSAWPKRFVAGDWDNDADENVLEQVVLAFDFYKLKGSVKSLAKKLAGA